jgi:hypothetical protein
MFIRPIFILVSLFIFSMLACKKDSIPTEHQNPPMQKSPKRGLSYDLVVPADLQVIKSGVSY